MRNFLWIGLLVAIAVVIARTNPIPGIAKPAQRIKFSQFMAELHNGNVKSVTVEKTKAHGSMALAGQDAKEFTVELPPSDQVLGQVMHALQEQSKRQSGLEVETPSPML